MECGTGECGDAVPLTWPDQVRVEWATEGKTGARQTLVSAVGLGAATVAGVGCRSWWVGIGVMVVCFGVGAWIDEAGRRRPVIRHVRRQLEERGGTECVWGTDPARCEVARAVCRAAAEAMKWPNDRFVPGDSVRIVFFDDWDGMDLLDLAYRVKKATGREWRWRDRRPETMGDLVDSFVEG